MSTRRAALGLVIVAWCAVVVAALVIALGPLSIPALGLSVSRPSRLLLAIGVLLGAAMAARGPRALLDDLARSPHAYVAIVGLAIAMLCGLLLARGAVSVGGADSAGYLAQAARWRAGILHAPLPLAVPGVPEAAWVQSGLGFRPDPSGLATVPSYPPGLPWLQAIAIGAAGEAAAVRGVPLMSAVIALLALACLAWPRVGAAGATLSVVTLASHPSFLFQALQPMSDVPALAAWLLALALAARRGTSAVAGSAAAMCVGILIRPNLSPLVAAVLWQAAIVAGSRVEARRRLLALGTAALAAVGAIALVQRALYGAATQSGYGRAAELFSIAYAPPNILLYTRWLVESTGWPGLAVVVIGGTLTVIRSVRDRAWRPLTLMAAATVALYLVYVPFDSWTYLRFVLIALALLPLGAAGLVNRAWHAEPALWRFPLCCALTILVAVPNLQRAQALGVFAVRAREYRYEAAGTFVRDRLPESAVIVAAQHSTSAPYYSGRPVLRADLLDETSLGLVAAWAAREQRPLAFVLDAAEADAIRSRLGDHPLAALDWPPRAEIGRPAATRVWLSSDRDAYHAGEAVPTVRLETARR